ncbi:MAG TPA: PilW family protein [Noviherbaspirillum sp.]|nr:PilW family protein [Noviherbaspirillum sp.]
MNNQKQSHSSKQIAHSAQSGFSLIELMVAITISLLILIAMITVYVNLSRSNNEMAKTNIQIENGRFAMQLLQNDISHAGYWGGYVPQFDDLSSTADPALASAGGTVPTAIPDPCLEYTAANWTETYKNNLLGIPVQGYDDVPAGCAALITNKKANTDVLVLRHADNCVAGAANCEPFTSGKLYLQSTNCATETGTPYVLDTTGHTLHNKDCTTVAAKRKFISSIYYIRDYAVTSGDNIPTLMRSRFELSSDSPPVLKHLDATPLIEGIEGFRVEFGIDNKSDTGANTDYTVKVAWADNTNLISPTNRGDGIPDGAFIRCTTASPCTADQMANAVAAKVYVLARSLEASPGHLDGKKYQLGSAAEIAPFNDAYKRHVFSTTVRLTNVSGRRETP